MLSQVDGSPPLPSDLIKSDGEEETLQIIFTGQIGTQWPYKQKRLNETFVIQSSGLVRFSIRVPDDFDKITISVRIFFDNNNINTGYSSHAIFSEEHITSCISYNLIITNYRNIVTKHCYKTFLQNIVTVLEH